MSSSSNKKEDDKFAILQQQAQSELIEHLRQQRQQQQQQKQQVQQQTSLPQQTPTQQYQQQQQHLSPQHSLQQQEQQQNLNRIAGSPPRTMTTVGSTAATDTMQSASSTTVPPLHLDNLRNPQMSIDRDALMAAMSAGGSSPDQFVQTYNSNVEGGERIVDLSPNGRYAKLNCILGKGAYKVVYKAIDREEGYEVAWNCFQTTKAEFTALSQEIEILKRVRHPNIINFHDCWFNNNEFVFVTELMTSGTLREYIRKLQSPNIKVVKRWCRQILKGLAYLHAHNPPIIHRDIKCDNIFINGAHGEVKIGDMGTAKMKLGKKYTVIGTPEFMAPEMYEEKGYNEKVDIYAFGMCLLEMVTGEYPYSECTNAAQIYKKVSQGLKPDCLHKVTDSEVIDILGKCICAENDRLSAAQLLEHPFLTVEPEVVLISASDDKINLVLQVLFRGMEKLSVKFEFNVENDTAEDVVNEMIQEKVLHQKYQVLITHEINRILRDLHKLSVENKGTKEESRQMWRRSDTTIMRDELDRAKLEVQKATVRALEAEKKAELSEVRARLAEERTVASPNLQDSMHSYNASSAIGSPGQTMISSTFVADNGKALTINTEDGQQTTVPLKDYKDEQAIEDLVHDTAVVNNRGVDKEREWLAKLHAQDVMTVGDLRDLHDEDWGNLGLTVFASRALRNALHGKQLRNISPKNAPSGSTGQPKSIVTTPPMSSMGGEYFASSSASTHNPASASTQQSTLAQTMHGGIQQAHVQSHSSQPSSGSTASGHANQIAHARRRSNAADVNSGLRNQQAVHEQQSMQHQDSNQQPYYDAESFDK
ncbi:hypothetical protein MP228_004912 [Amoeboaphelidium protococcarum]|nr:hypothetical protein MP228_004912 [Amoeboaphelidium protococcarum]